MKHIVSMVRDQTAHFAYVDEDTGQMVQFADLLVPDPERFAMTDAAALGTALIDYLGLNGSRKPVTPVTTVGSGIEARRRAAAAAEAEREEQVALAAEPAKTAPPKALAKTTNIGRPRKDGQPNVARPELAAQAYIPGEWVVEVINQYPEGINAHDIGERIWRTKLTAMSNGGTVEYPRWVTRAVENRITGFNQAHKDSGKPLPFMAETYATQGGMKRRLLKPLAAGAAPFEHRPTTTDTEGTLGL